MIRNFEVRGLRGADFEADNGLPTATRNAMTLAKTPKEKKDEYTEGEVQCAFCNDLFPVDDSLELRCSHDYCSDCVKQMMLGASEQESNYRLRCCDHAIPLDKASSVLNETEVEAYQDAEVEYASKDRVYCSNPRCGKFVPHTAYDEGGDGGLCTKCNQITCVKCKAKSHDGECSEDNSMQETLALLKKKGGQRCPNCKTAIEKTHGCNHMTLVMPFLPQRVHN